MTPTSGLTSDQQEVVGYMQAQIWITLLVLTMLLAG